MKTYRNSVVALLHGLRWEGPESSRQIADGISLHHLSGTLIEQRYHQLCEDRGVDTGEPFDYEVFVRFDPTNRDEYFLDAGDPYSAIDRLSNLLVIMTAHPIGMCRIMWSADDFSSVRDSILAYVTHGQVEFLEKDWPSVTRQISQDVAVAWTAQQKIWTNRKSRSRLITALTYFYYAWRSHYADQICLNLGIVLELLFAPHAQSETSHQIAYNVSRFLGTSGEEKRDHYRFVRRFYLMRSKVVHGGMPDDDALLDVVIKAFPFIASILRRFLLDESLALCLESDTERRRMLDNWLFE